MASRGEAREQETTKCPSFDPSRRDTTTALLRKHHFTRASARISRASASFTRSKIVFHRAALPRHVPGCRFVPFKIAASLSLLAMTNLVGFAEKRNNFRSETIENGTISGTKRLKDDAERHRAKRPHKAKTSVSQIKTYQICVIARSAATWQSLSQRYGIPQRSTGVETKTAALSQNHEIRCFVSLPLSFRVLFRSVQPYFVPE